MSVKAYVFSLFMFLAGRVAQNRVPRMSFEFHAPTWVRLLCGTSSVGRVEFSPMVVQLGAVAILFVSLFGDMHILSPRAVAWGRVGTFSITLIMSFAGAAFRRHRQL